MFHPNAVLRGSMFKKINRYLATLIFLALSIYSVQPAQALEPGLWQKLQDGEAVALLRHAIAPGNGDPAEFTLGDCATQRNLSSNGQEQAARIGALIKSQGIEQAVVYTSQWCRCTDTAVGLALGVVEPLPLLNSFYQDRSSESNQTNDLTQWIKKRLEISKNATILPAVLVSHQVNITSLTGVYPSSGELVLVSYEDNKLVVLGTVRTE